MKILFAKLAGLPACILLEKLYFTAEQEQNGNIEKEQIELYLRG